MKLIALLFLSLSILTSCSNPLESQSKCPCKVKIPRLQEDGTYRMEVVELQTLEDAKRIGSSKIQVTVDPRFYSNGSIDEQKPQAQFVYNNDGVIIPTRTQTAEMFSIYKTMEDLYLFDKTIGVDKIISYPRVVSLQTRSGRTKKSINNAFYAPFFDRIVVLKYVGEKIPLSINSGVLAHEHSHAIFNKIVNPINNTASDMKISSLHEGDNEIFVNPVTVEGVVGYNYLILKALDEGLADFWANLHTGLVNPYLASYSPAEKMNDRVVLPIVSQMDDQISLESIFNFELYKKEEVSVNEKSDRPIHGSVYGKAVMYSNLLKSLSEKMILNKKDAFDSYSSRVMQGQWIIASLKKLAKIAEAKGKKEIISQSDIVNSFVPDDADSETKIGICSDIKIFLTFHTDKASSCSGL